MTSSFDLGGRALRSGGKLPPPDCIGKNVDGTIVLNIRVDRTGKVIEATIGAGTKNITDEETRNCAIKAAKLAEFVSSNREIQSGTITYKYLLK